MNWAQHILVLLVRIYQWVISPTKDVLLGPAGQCRFTPSCSQYAVEALQKHGAVKGSLMAGWRICRCNPWGGCGEDPVPDKKSREKHINLKGVTSWRSQASVKPSAFGTASGEHS
ncbi:membrane protein insertion efficiency factor YidD [Pedosphaera parvula]|uniref:membrane protein insertion efficiency factor YidD n=1 Tax=Pedosphaera parvula TaxID=1032527 RepID=UPI0007C8764C|nr:membrane protein insertion efficiency factor YidD [Pedosphaera parvula]